jgi:hypothetical protein
LKEGRTLVTFLFESFKSFRKSRSAPSMWNPEAPREQSDKREKTLSLGMRTCGEKAVIREEKSSFSVGFHRHSTKLPF